MIKLLLILLFTTTFSICFSQEKIKIYNPEANAAKELDEAIALANKQNKHVFIQVGGNWCPWCIKFHKFIHDDKKLDSLLNANYVFLLLNYSKEKPEYKNLDIMSKLEYPQRFGFPVFVILDSDGKRLHTQDSGYLEADKSYDAGKVELLLKNWSKTALNPEKYKTK